VIAKRRSSHRSIWPGVAVLPALDPVGQVQDVQPPRTSTSHHVFIAASRIRRSPGAFHTIICAGSCGVMIGVVGSRGFGSTRIGHSPLTSDSVIAMSDMDSMSFARQIRAASESARTWPPSRKPRTVRRCALPLTISRE
jgi:hypothetical protein